MKNKLTVIITAALFLISGSSVFAANPNLNGVWILDKAKSEGLQPEMNQTMTVKQVGDNLSVATKIITKDGEKIFPKSYVLDGKEAAFSEIALVSTATEVPEGGDTVETTEAIKGRQTAKWTADGVEILELSTIDTPNGTINVRITRKWTLSADGKSLKVIINVQSPTVKSETKLAFNKAEK